MAALRFVGLTLLFTVFGVIAVLLDWLAVFGLIAVCKFDAFIELLLFLITGVSGPCWAGYVTSALIKRNCPETGNDARWPALIGYGLVALALMAIYGPLTLIGYFYRGVRM
jgi:hypothetical protein